MKWLLSSFVCFLMSGCALMHTTYPYHAITNDCNCEDFKLNDAKNNIEYHFRARYAMEEGIVTNVEIDFINRSNDTLFLDLASVKIFSRNVSYQYNNKFVPLPHLIILPSRSEVVKMTGSELTGKEDWNKIAGEQFKLTLKGIRLGDRLLPEQTVTFVPENPKIRL